MRTIKLTLAYDGTDYVGWQRQESGTSIQRLVEEAFEPIEGRLVPAMGASRTDAGVHALGQVASVRIEHTIDEATLVRALNARLPEDVRVLAAERVEDGFHARFQARRKTYRYGIVNAAAISPFERRHAWHIEQPLDLDAMAASMEAVVGRHDFGAFQAAGSDVKTTVRTVFRAEWKPGPPGTWWAAAPPGGGAGRLLVFEIAGDGFLRHMVRGIVGTAVEIGLGRRDRSALARLVDTADRAQTGPTAPAHGLFLVGVAY